MSVSMLCEQLAITGAAITVFTTTANGTDELPVVINQPVNLDGVTVIYFTRITKDHSHFSPSLLIKLWKEVENYDLVHVHAWWNLVSILSCLVALTRKIPVVLSPRGTLSAYSFANSNQKIKGSFHKFLGRRLLNKCYFHVTSEQEKKALLNIIQPKGMAIIPNLVKLPVNAGYQKEKQFAPDFKLLFFSRIDEKKGLDILLNALPMVSVPYCLTIAGSGDEAYIKYLKKLAADNHIDKHINWAGFRTENKFDLFNAHDLFILPSHDENFGNTIIESLSTGTAVLIGQNVGLANYTVKNNLGWLCETNPESVSTAINNIAVNYKNDLERIKKQAPAIIYKDFAPNNLVQQYLTLYNQIINYD